MISKSLQIKRLVWLISLLKAKGRATLVQINDAWERSSLSRDYPEALPVHRKVWYACFQAAAEIFGIVIECPNARSSESFYMIADDSIFKEDYTLQWIFAMMRVQIRTDECFSINHRILLEPFPSENGFFIPITEAMKNGHKLLVHYRKYGHSGTKEHVVAPYCIKSYRQRLYLIARFDSGRLCALCFDRIRNLQELTEPFRMDPSFHADEFFLDYFGVMMYCPHYDAPVSIRLRAYGDERFYLRDVPLHHSQREVVSSSDYSEFSLRLFPTFDFIGAILQQGDRIEVLSPPELRNQIASYILAMGSRYGLNAIG